MSNTGKRQVDALGMQRGEASDDGVDGGHEFNSVIPGRERSERTRNPYSATPGLWIPGSRPEPAIGPAFGRTRWAAPRNDG